jgi:AcrR family transcriptional regulator
MELTSQFHHSRMRKPGLARSAAPSRSREDRHASKHAHILRIASRVFARRSYHLVNMDAVAKSAGVGKGTLYRYFPSKEDLYLSLVDEAFSLMIRRLEREQAADLAPPVALARMIAAIVETFAQHLPYFRLMQRGEARLLHRKKQVIRARRGHIEQLVAHTIDRGITSGVFRKVDRPVAASMLIGMVWGTTLHHGEETPAEILGQRVADLYLHGLLHPPGDAVR